MAVEGICGAGDGVVMVLGGKKESGHYEDHRESIGGAAVTNSTNSKTSQARGQTEQTERERLHESLIYRMAFQATLYPRLCISETILSFWSSVNCVGQATDSTDWNRSTWAFSSHLTGMLSAWRRSETAAAVVKERKFRKNGERGEAAAMLRQRVEDEAEGTRSEGGEMARKDGRAERKDVEKSERRRRGQANNHVMRETGSAVP